MKAVVFCGHASSGAEAVYRATAAMGLSMPVAATRSGLLPQDLQEKLLKLSGIEASTDWSVPESPGNLWHELAADLFLSNVDSALWGWCDTRHAPFLDFWKSFDAGIQFVLTYTPPQHALAAAMSTGSRDAIDKAARDWRRFNEILLRFYMSNQDRCVLVNTRSTDFGARFPSVLKERLALQFSDDTWSPPGSEARALEALLGRELLTDATEVIDLLYSLESVADVPANSERGLAELEQALAELRRYQEAEDTSAAKLEALRNDARVQHQMLVVQLRESQEELDRCAARVEEFVANEHSRAGSVVIDASEPIEQLFDARTGFSGDNWYYPEDDGRWAGPLDISTIRLPRLGPGRYQLNLEVAACMAPDILEGLRCYLNGQEVTLEGAWAGCPANLYGEFVRAAGTHREAELQLQFPRTVSPADQGENSDDHRKLAIRLRTVLIRALDMRDQESEGASHV